MFAFKNLRVFRLEEGWEPTAEELAEKLGRCPFQPCGASDLKSSGWVAPREDGPHAYCVNRQILITLCTEERMLPGSVVKKATNAKAKELEKQQGYKPGRAQLREIKEQVTAELLPRAFTKERHSLVWIDPVGGWFVVDGSPARADEVIEHLKLALDGVPLLPVRTALSPVAAMTDWLVSGEAPAGFSIDRDCELRAMAEEKATVKYARHSLDGDEVRHHVEAGKKATRLAMTWEDKISFVLTESMEIKRLAFLDVLAEQAEQQASENAADVFDVDFTIMTGELARMLPAIVAALGGEAEA